MDNDSHPTRRQMLERMAAAAGAATLLCRPRTIPFKSLPTIDKNLLEEFRTLEPGETVPTFIMCPPNKSVMRPRNAEFDRKTLHNWSLLKQTIEGVGGKVVTIDDNSPNTGYREVWTRDAAIVFPKLKMFLTSTSLPANVEVKADAETVARISREHAANTVQLSHALVRQGFKKIEVTHPLSEGGDVLVDERRRLVFVGYDHKHPEKVKPTLEAIEKATGYKAVPIPRGFEDERHSYHLYHLDTGMAQLPKGEYLISESLTNVETLAKLQKMLGKDLIVVKDRLGKDFDQREFSETNRVTDREMENAYRAENISHMAYNLISVGKTLIMPGCEGGLEKDLQNRGYKVLTPEKLGLPQRSWNISNAAIHCATQQIAKRAGIQAGQLCHLITPQEGISRSTGWDRG